MKQVEHISGHEKTNRFKSLHPVIQDMSRELNARCLACAEPECPNHISASKRKHIIPMSHCIVDDMPAQYRYSEKFLRLMAEDCDEEINPELAAGVVKSLMSVPKKDRDMLREQFREVLQPKYRSFAEQIVDEGRRANEALKSDLFANMAVAFHMGISMLTPTPQ